MLQERVKVGTIKNQQDLNKIKKITQKQWEKNPMDDKIDEKFKIVEGSSRDKKADKRNTGIFNANRNKPKKQILKILIQKNKGK